jgi:cation/acetate symporter
LKIATELENKQKSGAVLTQKEQGELKAAKAAYEKNKDGTSFIFGLDNALFPLKNPGIVSIPLGFFSAWLFSILSRRKEEEDAFDELYVRQNTGVGIDKAIEH